MPKRRKLVERLFARSQSRGREAAGFAVFRDGELRIHRAALSAESMLASTSMHALMQWAFAPGESGTWACLGHARLATNGSESNSRNNQPIQAEACALVHNGIVVNDAALWPRMPEQRREGDVDSEALLKYWLHYRNLDLAAEEAWQKVYAEIEGTASIGIIDAQNKTMGWVTNNGSIYTYEDKGAVVFASERPALESVLRSLRIEPRSRQSMPSKTNSSWVQNLPAGKGQWLSLVETRDTQNSPQTFTAPHTFSLLPGPNLTASDKRNPVTSELPVTPKLRRCLRCILPETMPFIRFDEQGICQWCRNHQPLALKGSESLERILASYRRKDGKPDCLVAFSGGRDSSYGLHLLKRELGMHPVAFTYDWGMVTDLARRNQARLCGALGVEQILVADDMRLKRRNIRLNLEAWLRKPHLGMLPLLMAGDKHFFTHANRIGREMGIELIVFFENPYEQTRFKTGFLGVEEKVGRVYDLKFLQSLQLAMAYGREFLKNPGYINASLLDTFKAFIASYGKAHPYLFPFQFLPWRESEVDAVLLNQYGWETSPDSPSTWRIGDGTAAFYNYVYHTVAGFTEFDTFRSNLVREGCMTREVALSAIARENQPRWDSLREYLDRVGVDFTKAIETVNSMPRLYQG